MWGSIMVIHDSSWTSSLKNINCDTLEVFTHHWCSLPRMQDICDNFALRTISKIDKLGLLAIFNLCTCIWSPPTLIYYMSCLIYWQCLQRATHISVPFRGMLLAIVFWSPHLFIISFGGPYTMGARSLFCAFS